MLTIEVFRPDEMSLTLKEKMNKQSLKKLRGKQPDNPYLAELSENLDEGLI